MTNTALTVDETILVLLREGGVTSCAAVAEHVGTHARSARRRLRRLVNGGYVFSPEHGRYRITAAGIAAIALLPTTPSEAGPDLEPQERLLHRWWRRE